MPAEQAYKRELLEVLPPRIISPKMAKWPRVTVRIDLSLSVLEAFVTEIAIEVSKKQKKMNNRRKKMKITSLVSP